MKLEKNETKRLQGIAILFMLGLHLFNRSEITNYYDVRIYLGGGVPLLTVISYIFDACVPLYLFCSGYGLYISERSGSNMQKRFQRVFKLLFRFWIVMILICCVGFVLGRIEVEGISLFVNALMLLLRSQFSFVLGMIFAKEGILDRWKWLTRIRENQILPWIFLIIVVAVRGTILRHMIFTPTLVFCSRNVVMIMLTLVGLSLAASYVVDWVYNKVSLIVFEK